MKKLMTLFIAAAFTLPTFAFGIGENVTYAPSSNSSNAVLTKVAPYDGAMYEVQLTSDGITYTYIVKDGDEITLYKKANAKAKSLSAKTVKISDLKNNSVSFNDGSSNSSTQYFDAK